MKLHQSLFLNIISLFGYIDLFFQFASIYSEFVARVFDIGYALNLLTTFHPIRIPATLILLILSVIEFFIIRTKKWQPIIKTDNKIFKIFFYLTITISFLYTISLLYVLYKYAY